MHASSAPRHCKVVVHWVEVELSHVSHLMVFVF